MTESHIVVLIRQGPDFYFQVDVGPDHAEPPLELSRYESGELSAAEQPVLYYKQVGLPMGEALAQGRRVRTRQMDLEIVNPAPDLWLYCFGLGISRDEIKQHLQAVTFGPTEIAMIKGGRWPFHKPMPLKLKLELRLKLSAMSQPEFTCSHSFQWSDPDLYQQLTIHIIFSRRMDRTLLEIRPLIIVTLYCLSEAETVDLKKFGGDIHQCVVNLIATNEALMEQISSIVRPYPSGTASWQLSDLRSIFE